MFVDLENADQAVATALATLEIGHKMPQRVAKSRFNNVFSWQPEEEPANTFHNRLHALHHLA